MVFLCSGCFLLRARQDIAQLDLASRLAGHITVLGSHATPVVITLIRRLGPKEWKPERQWVRYGSGDFECLVGSGEFIILAWEDVNEDLAFQATENVGWHGPKKEPEIITTTPGSQFEDLAVQLQVPSSASKALPALYSNPKVHERFELPNDRNGEVIALDDARLREEVGGIGMWEPVRFVREGYHGIFFLEPYAPTKIPVLLVHGINSSGGAFVDLIEHIDRSRFQPWIAQYPSGMRLGLVADHMHRSIAKLQVEHSFKDMILVAHSMGGLVSRGIINRCVENEHDWVRQFVTFSSPFGGHDAAQLGVSYSPAVVPSWIDMVPESSYLKTLFDPQLPKNLPHHLAFSYRGNGDDGVVTIKSQLRPEAQESATSIRGFDQDHMGILSDEASAAFFRATLDAAERRMRR
ncbi:MAG: pimeloyl-ACP methyl ester carboxylesterase [Neolewinella sp.]|jgi:pimeloyl-ACP methyl ester carboxylesterase